MIFAILIAIIAALVTTSAELSSLAALDVAKVMDGEFWRLFSGHLAHLSWRHYAADVPVFTLLYITYARKTAPSSAVLLSIFAALSVSLVVIFAGMHQVYGGLSGLSCAAVSAILLTMIMEQPRQTLPYLMSIIYCIYLLCMGGHASGVKVAHEAHLAGAASGLAFVLMPGWRASTRCAHARDRF